MLIKMEFPGVVVDFKNETESHKDVVYASVTAPQLTYVEVKVDDEVHDGVYVAPGSSHSWCTNAGGKLLPHNGLKPGARLVVTADGPCAFRLDWI